MKKSNLIYLITFCLNILLLSDFILDAQTPGFTVAKDGSGDFSSVQAAVNAAPSNSSSRTVIYIKKGTYYELISISSSKTNLTFIGESADSTILTYDNGANTINPATGQKYGTSGSRSVQIDGAGFFAENITFQNNADPSLGQAVAVRCNADKSVFKNCRFLGNQDTYYADKGRSYHVNCYFEGTTDFIFGAAIAYFEKCQIYCKGGTSVTAASTAENVAYGYVFNNCTITGAGSNITDLGRPWSPYASVTFLNSNLSNAIKLTGWNNWGNTSKELTARYSEYNNTGAGANLSGRVSWMKKLTDMDAQNYNVFNVLKATNANPQVIDNWSPFEVLGVSVPDITVKITSPSDSAGFADNSSVIIDAQVSDTSGEVANVKFYSDSLLCEDISAPYTFTWNNVKSGVYQVLITATDTSGFTGYSKKITLFVGSGISITSPASGSRFTVPADIPIYVDEWDYAGPISNIEFFQGTTSLGIDSIPPYSFIWKNVPPGSYSLSAKATKHDSNVFISGEVSVSMVDGPDGYDFCSYEGGTCTFTDTVNVAYGADGYFNYLYNVTGTITCNSFTFGDPIYGTVKECYSQPAIMPYGTITSPKSDTSFIAPANITIMADAFDNDGTISNVEFFNDTISLGSDNSKPYSITWNNLAAGKYNITAKLTDNDGQSSTTPIVVVTVIANTTSIIDKDNKVMTFYPNPVSDELILKLNNNSSDNMYVSLYNSQGILVLKKKLAGSEDKLNLANIPDGIYSITLNNNNKEVLTRQIIKIK